MVTKAKHRAENPKGLRISLEDYLTSGMTVNGLDGGLLGSR